MKERYDIKNDNSSTEFKMKHGISKIKEWL